MSHKSQVLLSGAVFDSRFTALDRLGRVVAVVPQESEVCMVADYLSSVMYGTEETTLREETSAHAYLAHAVLPGCCGLAYRSGTRGGVVLVNRHADDYGQPKEFGRHPCGCRAPPETITVPRPLACAQCGDRSVP